MSGKRKQKGSSGSVKVTPVMPVAQAAPVTSDMASVRSTSSRPVAAPAVSAVELRASSRSVLPVASVSPEYRRELIALKAFERALAHGLGSTDPVADWLAAEQEVDELVCVA